MFIGATLLYPDLANLIMSEEGLSLFGMRLAQFSYGSTVIPVILAVWFMSYVEKLARKICPKVISSFGVPTLTFLIAVPVTFLVIGPLGAMLTGALSSGVAWLTENVPFLAIAVPAALMPILVMGGLHMALIPVMVTILTVTGHDPIISSAFMIYNVGAAGTALAYALRSRDPEKKQTGFSCTVSALVGVTEPTLFGIMVAEHRPLVTTIAACACVGLLGGLINYQCYVPMSQSLLSIPAAAVGGTENVVRCAILAAVSFAACFVACWLFGTDREDS